MTTLDFRKQKKKYLKVTLNDEQETKLSLLQPTKQLFDKLVAMGDELTHIAQAEMSTIEEVYDVCAQLMSRNKEGIPVERQTLEEILDFEDLTIFLQAYGAFVADLINAKN